MKIIDVNAQAGFWPIQRLTDRSLPELDRTFDQLGVEQVWLSAIESILFPEPDSHDWALFERLAEFPRFRPVKTINPLLGNWKKSIAYAVSRFSIAGLKLFPNYHGYALNSETVRELCVVARDQNLPILIQMRVNDERNQPHFLQVHGVPAEQVAELSTSFRENLMIALCAYASEVPKLAMGSANLLVDLSFLDEAESIERFAGDIPLDRIVFGSHAPFLHAQSAYMKLTHFKLSESLRRSVALDNVLSRRSERVGPF